MRAAVLALVALLLTLPASAQPAAEVESVESEWWAWRLADDPLFASYVGVRDHDDRLQDVTAEARAARAAQAARFLDRLDAIDADALEGEARITEGILRTMLGDVIDADRFGAALMPVTASDGFHAAFTRLPSQMPMTTPLIVPTTAADNAKPR